MQNGLVVTPLPLLLDRHPESECPDLHIPLIEGQRLGPVTLFLLDPTEQLLLSLLLRPFLLSLLLHPVIILRVQSTSPLQLSHLLLSLEVTVLLLVFLPDLLCLCPTHLAAHVDLLQVLLDYPAIHLLLLHPLVVLGQVGQEVARLPLRTLQHTVDILVLLRIHGPFVTTIELDGAQVYVQGSLDLGLEHPEVPPLQEEVPGSLAVQGFQLLHLPHERVLIQHLECQCRPSLLSLLQKRRYHRGF